MQGVGAQNASIKVYIANRPDYADLARCTSMRPLSKGEVSAIGQACGNGWRKVFNCYAKFLYALNFKECALDSSWQVYRDRCLLQADSLAALVFSKPCIAASTAQVSILMGKTYAKGLLAEGVLPQLQLTWLSDAFAIDASHKFIVCPYFDYRQLTNRHIIQLVDLVKPLYRQLQ